METLRERLDKQQYLAMRWYELIREKALVENWSAQFEVFKAGVGEPPSATSKLCHKDKSRPMGPENYRWTP